MGLYKNQRKEVEKHLMQKQINVGSVPGDASLNIIDMHYELKE